MTDIVQRLRDTIINETPARYPDVIEAAITEIEKLRETKPQLSWMLRAYAARCVLADWSKATAGDHEWADALALCIDRFAKDWVATNCAGRKPKGST